MNVKSRVGWINFFEKKLNFVWCFKIRSRLSYNGVI